MQTNCPKCKSESITPVRWTWWGGVLGPMIFKTSKCNDCGASFSTKTGEPASKAAIIYTLGVVLVVLVILFVGLKFL